MDEMNPSRACPVGLLTTDYYDNLNTFIHEATEAGHDFIATPIAQPRFQRVLGEEGITKESLDIWRDSPHFERDDLILKSADWADAVVGVLSNWLQLDSTNELPRVNSELALKQELAWACHLGLLAVILPSLPRGSLSNLARAVGNGVMSMSYTQMWVRVPLTDSEDIDGNLSWRQWNKFRALTDHNPKIHVALELTADLPLDNQLLDVWLSEPIKAVIIPAEIFVSNAKGYPVLSKRHQSFLKTIMDKLRPNMIVTMPTTQLHTAATPSSYQEYIRYLNRNLPELDDVERFAVGYQDYLQAPLQPLMDNLDNQTYETFEKDPIKYQQYEKAVYHALLDRVEHGSDYESLIMVVGAGRGPLVNCCLRAAEKAERKVHIYAIEKNPNAFVTLQNAKADVWQDKVTLVFADMRKWKPSRKCDILVSELLGSFGDNELSPECLDGAQKFLKSDGISIPSSYTAFVSPMASTKLYNEVAAYKDLTHFETPYVVMFQQVCELARPKPLWVFEHPNTTDVPVDSDPINNLHNIRYQQVEFEAQHDMTMHGLAGYFESVLYKDVMISIHPDTHSPGMFSWFPIFFPIRTPIQVPKGSVITVDIWRQTDRKKVWYEWTVTVSSQDRRRDLTVLPIHNVGGRSYWVGL
ncbi:Protein arginine N-methyltransferase 5 [Apophysomyces sp. BC1034]|nr:Protein arginine N-methyltransferase 5 [Apophysomyces sp. BC1015]KAG0176861.1 Protein arginine N-methyltransferase 5 [Apophysomyces sp. BC1021]KAG0187170.1 Protein arginine N-methyltransferase 5 [Apophysomyces sp. BC1034]